MSDSVTPPINRDRTTSAEYGVAWDMSDESGLIFKAESYAKNNGHRILRKARLRTETDGEVWRSTRPSAIKVIVNAKNYRDELESYKRLKDSQYPPAVWVRHSQTLRMGRCLAGH